jgi:ornithine carbamoyltransferase
MRAANRGSDELNFKGRDFLSLTDFQKAEIIYILETADELKRKWHRHEPHELLRGRTVAMLFEKPSTRTRTSFQAAIAHLGAQSFYMRPDELQLSRGEPIKDTARVIDRYCDALVIRTYGQEKLEAFAGFMVNPVVNALSDLTHPCQGLADLQTIREKKGRLERLKVAYSGDVWNVCHSLMIGCSLFGIDIFVARPKGYDLNPKVLKFAQEHATANSSQCVVTEDLEEALRQADVVYANTWHSMGSAEKEKERRLRDFGPYQINDQNTKNAKPDFIFMHCLPGYRGEEMTEGIVEGTHSVVWDQAENRMHTEKAVLSLFIR